jgi:hypothetical protein
MEDIFMKNSEMSEDWNILWKEKNNGKRFLRVVWRSSEKGERHFLRGAARKENDIF